MMGITASKNIKDFDKKDRFRFSGLRVKVLSRDGFLCVSCGMTQDQHIAKYNKSLTINHKDGNGRNSKKPNNDLNNLETLCLPCHGRADCQNKKWKIRTAY